MRKPNDLPLNHYHRRNRYLLVMSPEPESFPFVGIATRGNREPSEGYCLTPPEKEEMASYRPLSGSQTYLGSLENNQTIQAVKQAFD